MCEIQTPNPSKVSFIGQYTTRSRARRAPEKGTIGHQRLRRQAHSAAADISSLLLNKA